MPSVAREWVSGTERYGSPGDWHDSERNPMTTDNEAVETAAAELTHAMSKLVKALDDVADDGEAVRRLPEGLAAALGRLVERISAAEGFAE